jgi:hypothetical protein
VNGVPTKSLAIAWLVIGIGSHRTNRWEKTFFSTIVVVRTGLKLAPFWALFLHWSMQSANRYTMTCVLLHRVHQWVEGELCGGRCENPNVIPWGFDKIVCYLDGEV